MKKNEFKFDDIQVNGGEKEARMVVLILVVVEDGLVLSGNHIIIPVNAVS